MMKLRIMPSSVMLSAVNAERLAFYIVMLSVFMLSVAMAECRCAKTAHPEVKGSNLAAPWSQA